MSDTIKQVIDTAKDIHHDAYEKAKDKMPELGVNEIISLLVQVYEAKDNRFAAAKEAAETLAAKYKEPAEIYLNAFCVEAVNLGLKKFDNDKIGELADAGYCCG